MTIEESLWVCLSELPMWSIRISCTGSGSGKDPGSHDSTHWDNFLWKISFGTCFPETRFCEMSPLVFLNNSQNQVQVAELVFILVKVHYEQHFDYSVQIVQKFC